MHVTSKLELDHVLKQDIPRSNYGRAQIFEICLRCKKALYKIDSGSTHCESCQMLDTIEMPNELPDKPDKLCQLCVERGYSNPRHASRMWLNGITVCDDCYEPLLNSLLSGIPNHFSDVLTSSDVLDHRDKIFNYHHQMVANMTQDELVDKLEDYKKILFTIRIFSEDVQDLINIYRNKNRSEKSLNEVAKPPKSSSAGAKLKQSKDEKTMASLAKTLGMSIEQYKNLMTKGVKQARQEEFKDLLNGKVQSSESLPELEIDGRTKAQKDNDAKEEIPKGPKKCPLCSLEMQEGQSLLSHYKVCEKRQK